MKAGSKINTPTMQPHVFATAIKGKWQQWQHMLTGTTIPAWIMGYVRIVMGLTVLHDLWDYRYYFTETLPQSEFFFTYDGFHWVRPLPNEYMFYLVYGLMAVAAVYITGAFFRISAAVLTIGYTYLFLLDKGHYNNHYYLYCLLLILLCFTGAGKGLSVTSWWKGEDVRLPAWQLVIIKLQICVVYFFGGIAKLNYDWLHGYPMRYWLSYDADKLEPGLLSNFMHTQSAAYFYSYGGLVFDLAIPFLLWMPRTRLYILPVVVFFHISNHFNYDIGSFPWVMLFITVLFFDADKIRQYFKTTGNGGKHAHNIAAEITGKGRQVAVIGFVTIWLAIQVLFPLRRYCFEGNPSWTGQGHLFAWRMMLTDTVEAVKIRIQVPDENQDFYVDIFEYINFTQFFKGMRTPMSILHFVEKIKGDLARAGVLEKSIITLEVYKSVNGRPPVLFSDTTLNYAHVDYQPLQSQNWMLPWSPTDVPLEFTPEKYVHWKKLLREQEGRNSLENGRL